MILYGDPQIQTTLRSIAGELMTRSRCARDSDSLRDLLICTGQLEQGVADAGLHSDILRNAEACTDLAAAAFHHGGEESHRQLADYQRTLSRVTATEDCSLTLKVPEGFAFYTLYPEFYARAAERWAEEQKSVGSKRVLVVGLRSIGTTLSAVVRDKLRTLGWQAERVTVRPSGHPFQREVELRGFEAARDQFAVVVDEGPGQSGSSMVAAAQALVRAGISQQQIAFLPGHGNPPGASASKKVRDWWHQTRTYVSTAADAVWSGKTLEEMLAGKTEELLGSSVTHLRDASGGLWRQLAYEHENEWPAANIPFERTKLLIEAANGTRLLWKFEGLGKALAVADLRSANLSSTIAQRPIASHLGFVAYRWIEGKRLAATDCTRAIESALTQYVSARASQPLSCEEAAAGITRLAEMLYWNTREAIGERAADGTRALAEAAMDFVRSTELPTYGDGRMAPQEFIKAENGTLWKTDCDGHVRDHTVVGEQCILWDAAGVAVEWEVEPSRQISITRELAQHVPVNVWQFYRAGYAAFRLAMMQASEGFGAERRRAAEASQRYRATLHSVLQPTIAGQPMLVTSN